MSIEKETKESMEQAIAHLQKELKTLRSSRANPEILDSVQVEAYGTQMRLKELANVTTPEARQLLITPFDPSTLQAISKAIELSDLGLRPMAEGQSLRITIPPMDESTRKEIAKQCKKKAEEAKVSIRDVRRKSNELARKQKADGDIAEDELKKEEKKIQDLTDAYCKKVDDICTTKEKEILAV
jgi:ribosome recycling factor